MGIIQDGRGTGQSAEVDDHGRLSVKANIVSHMSHHATYHKNAFVCTFDTTLQGTSSTPVAFLKNDKSGADFEIYWVKISSDANVEILVSGNDTRTSGGTTCTPTNTNLGSNITSSATIYKGGSAGDLVLASTVAVDLNGFFMGANAPTVFSYEGGLVLPFTKSIAIRAIGASSDKVKVTIGYAIHSEGARL